MLDLGNLNAKLLNAGLPVVGVSLSFNRAEYEDASKCRLFWADGHPTAQEQADADAILVAYDQVAEDAAQAAVDAVMASSDAAASNIPGWATWDEATALAWIDTNVTNLASAKTVLEAQTRMLIAIRNKLWPHLQQ